MLESKILAVADVVEAMASHRPYRSALGIEAALNEISAQRGITLDAKAVDALSSKYHQTSAAINFTRKPESTTI